MFATGGSRLPKDSPPELVAALDLYRFGGAARLTWTEYQAMDQYTLDLLGVVEAAAESARSRRSGGEG